jgi:hypothetical protein
MIRRLSAPFRTISATDPLNIQDTSLQDTTGNVGRTTGSTLTDAVPLQPPSPAKWTLLSYSVQGLLTLKPTIATDGIWAAFRRIFVCIQTTVAPTPISGGAPWSGAMAPLPNDTTLGADLWDPATDPLPPLLPGVPSQPFQALSVAAQVNLPQPIDIAAGSLFISIFMLPHMVSNTGGLGLAADIGRQLCFANYTLIYDDGLGPSKDIASGS